MRERPDAREPAGGAVDRVRAGHLRRTLDLTAACTRRRGDRMMTLLSRDENAILELDFKIECACDVGAEKGPLTKNLFYRD